MAPAKHITALCRITHRPLQRVATRIFSRTIGADLRDASTRDVRQTFDKIFLKLSAAHEGLVKQLRKTHPEVDIVLIEPSQSDYQMTFSNVMRYSTRLMLARHGFETVTLKLAENYAYFDNLLSRHGIAITERLVDVELDAIRAADYKPAVLQRILERRPAQPKRLSTPSVTESLSTLSDTLNDLDTILTDWPNYQNKRPARQSAADTIGARTPARSLE